MSTSATQECESCSHNIPAIHKKNYNSVNKINISRHDILPALPIIGATVSLRAPTENGPFRPTVCTHATTLKMQNGSHYIQYCKILQKTSNHFNFNDDALHTFRFTFREELYKYLSE
jgi:hypothetical protein